MEHVTSTASSMPKRGRWRTILETVTTVAMLGASLTIVVTHFWSNRQSPALRKEMALPAEPLSLDGASIMGSKTAPIGLLVFSDFQCPFCAKFAKEVLPGIEGDIKAGRVLLAFRHLPLAIHPLAQKAAEAALCAGREGKFWQAHDHLFGDVERLKPASLLAMSGALGLNTAAFEACFAGQTTAEVQRDTAEATRLGITGTPLSLIGTIGQNGQFRATKVIKGGSGVRAALDAALGSASDVKR
jgi:protein-disulfide isomerase